MKKFVKRLFKILFWCSGIMIIVSFFMTSIPASSFALAPFLAYSLPAFVLINVSYLFLVFYKKKYWLITGCFFLFGLIGLKNTYALNIGSEKGQLKIMSYNVRLFDVYNWLQRATWDDWEERKDNGLILDSIYKTIDQEQCGVVCFQEYLNQPFGTYRTKKTLKKMGYKYVHDAYTYKEKGSQYGMATFSKYKIVNKAFIPFQNAQNNGVLITDILKDSDTIRVFNCHLQSFKFGSQHYKYLKNLKDSTLEAIDVSQTKDLISQLSNGFEKRTKQLELIQRLMKESKFPVVLCADLNEIPLSYVYEELKTDLKDAFLEAGFGMGITHAGNYPFMRIDYIFTSDHFTSTAFNVIDRELSDHYPITAELDW